MFCGGTGHKLRRKKGFGCDREIHGERKIFFLLCYLFPSVKTSEDMRFMEFAESVELGSPCIMQRISKLVLCSLSRSGVSPDRATAIKKGEKFTCQKNIYYLNFANVLFINSRQKYRSLCKTGSRNRFETIFSKRFSSG